MSSSPGADATVTLSLEHHAGNIDRRIFSGFLEHIGRAIYEGVYDPDSQLHDEDGLRTDVLDALRPLQMPLIRYPGGNFVSSYDWRDGIGPRADRPTRPDFAWKSRESNAFGTDEFMRFCAKLDTAPMLAVNLGTLGANEAAALLEYCNLPAGTYWADRRVANGNAKPYGVKVWCLGNEMDGPWQAGHVPAHVYALRADQAGKMMKGLDGSIELVACGSSGRFMRTYLEWDREVLEYCWDGIDYISAHRYSNNDRNDSAWYLAEGVEIDRVIEDYAALLGYVRGVKKSHKRVYLSFDEWNVWYKDRNGDGGWKFAPHLLEEVYNLEDALVCAQYLNSFIRHADVVKVACLAQIVNVIAPILTRRDGLLLQASYYPIVTMAQHAHGNALQPVVCAPLIKAGDRGEVPQLDVSACHDPETDAAAFFFVNRSTTASLNVRVHVNGARVTGISVAEQLTGSDPKLANSWENPKAIQPSRASAKLSEHGGLEVTVPRLGFVAVRATVAKK